jgi:putative phosphoribosyl transferase
LPFLWGAPVIGHKAFPVRAARYQDRAEAAQVLLDALPPLTNQKTVVIALPRGGVPVAAPIAQALGAPLDVILVRKVGAPGNPELAVGAITGSAEGDLYLNAPVMRAVGLSRTEVQALAKKELSELTRRRDTYLPGQAPAPLEGRTVILVDDGIATGSTVRAALHAIRSKGPEKIILAVPVASSEVLAELRKDVDLIVCPEPHLPLGAVGAAYQSFPQTSDNEVIALLRSARDAAPKEPN